jgi:hypothetical protein
VDCRFHTLPPGDIDSLRPAGDAVADRGFDRVTVRKIHDGLFSGPDTRTIVDALAAWPVWAMARV